jgi:hypothetical protein
MRGGSGGGGAAWRDEEKPARGRASGGHGAGGHVARRRAARGQLGLGKAAGVRRVSRARAEQGRGLEVDDEDLVVIFQKCRDSTVKPK